MKIKEYAITRGLKQTISTKKPNGTVDYNSSEASVSVTIENPKGKDIAEANKRAFDEALRELERDVIDDFPEREKEGEK